MCSSLKPKSQEAWERGGGERRGVASWQHDSNLKLATVPLTVSLCLIVSPHTAFMVSQAKHVSLKSRARTGSITYGGSTHLANSGNHLGVSSFTYSYTWDTITMGRTCKYGDNTSKEVTDGQWMSPAGRRWCFCDVKMTWEKGSVEIKEADGRRKERRSLEPRKNMLRWPMVHCILAGTQWQTSVQRGFLQEKIFKLSLSRTFQAM